MSQPIVVIFRTSSINNVLILRPNWMPNIKKRKLDSFKRTGGHDKANSRFCKGVLRKRLLRQ